jgi:predicted TIM-barrel fold metal-dependent hydrolase
VYIVSRLFASNYPAAVVERLRTSSWVWHVDVGTHVLRLYSAGLFAKLNLIIGRNGESLSIFIDRIDSMGLRNGATFDRAWKTNIWSTTVAFSTVRQSEQLIKGTAVEEIMFPANYPFSTNTDGRTFVEKLAQARLLSDAVMDMFAWRNIKRMIKLRVAAIK